VGTVIPKPEAKSDRTKRRGKRRGRPAIIYTIPNQRNADRPFEKGVNDLELQRAYDELLASGQFTRQWFNENLPLCRDEGGCNFTTIGGLFTLLGEAYYARPGTYKRKSDGD